MRELFEQSNAAQRKLKTVSISMQAKSHELENRLETALQEIDKLQIKML